MVEIIPAYPTNLNYLPDVKPAGLTQTVAQTLPEAVARIVQQLHPEKIILFGSYAYGRPTPDSDVDLLVIMETESTEVDRFLSVARLLRPRRFPVDILVKTPDEIEYALSYSDFFLSEIIRRGIVLYDRTS